jgi:hypothetical protein
MIIDLLIVIHTSRFVHTVDNPHTSFLNPRQKQNKNNCLNAIRPAHNTRGLPTSDLNQVKAQMSCTWDKQKDKGMTTSQGNKLNKRHT